MKKIVLLILISICILGCRTKKVLRSESSETKKVEASSTSKAETKESVKESKNIESSTVNSASIKDNKSSVEISGKVNKENPLIYYNIVDGDTVGSIGISGIADFVIKNNNSNSQSDNSNTGISKSEAINSKSSTVAVAVDNISKVATEAQSKTIEVVKKEFTLGVYLSWIIIGVIIIGITVGIFYIKKSTWWTKILTKFRSK